ncbi:hypothetical protein HanXRQr2_Chr08g0335551 [Helianthus annuus]|uniref:Uncharacterized protein n=1 Tax=Helianthus annuus TaxID=4232 RepID=A0A9K3NCE6_HELAN|nr:hypothetical protein HanXRQr2_Chr08g0335551 [Helianthus annuus]KAJ0901338.1 hypothetical protein HanPSC8_Chr08g0324181 [Helianthus annuus]
MNLVISIIVAVRKNDIQCTPAEVLAMLSDPGRVFRALFMFPTLFSMIVRQVLGFSSVVMRIYYQDTHWNSSG